RGRPGLVAQDPGTRCDAHGDAAALVFVSVVLVIVRVRAGDHDAALLAKGLLLGRRRDVSFTRRHDARLVRVLLLQMRGHVGMVHREAADEPREEAVRAEPRPGELIDELERQVHYLLGLLLFYLLLLQE